MSLCAANATTRLSLQNIRNNILNLFLPSGAVHVGINLGREYALVTEHFLYHPQISPILYQMGGEGVAESVWRDVFAYASAKGSVLYEIEDRDPTERRAETV